MKTLLKSSTLRCRLTSIILYNHVSYKSRLKTGTFQFLKTAAQTLKGSVSDMNLYLKKSENKYIDP
jgi:hypothetical protein